MQRLYIYAKIALYHQVQLIGASSSLDFSFCLLPISVSFTIGLKKQFFCLLSKTTFAAIATKYYPTIKIMLPNH